MSVALACTAKSAAAAEHDAWVLKQNSQLAGRHTICVSNTAVRIENLEHAYVILLRAPDWKLVMYNTRSKKVCTKNSKDFAGTLAFGSGMMGEGGYLQSLPLRKNPTAGTFKGLSALHYTTGKFQVPEPAKRQRSPIGAVSIFSATDLESADYWIWNNDPAAAQAGSILQKIYRLPLRAGLPLNLVYTDIAGKKTSELDTLSINKSKLPDDKFAPPKGLIAVKSEDEVVFDETKKKKINRAAEMFDGWRDTWGR